MGNTNRILVVTDSLGLPRPGIGLPYRDTYLARIEDRLGGAVWVMSRGGAFSNEVSERVENVGSYLEENMFRLGVVQVGLVDCAPRPIPDPVRERISRLPSIIRRPIVRTLHLLRPYIQGKFGYYQVTPPQEFTREYTRLLDAVDRLCKETFIISIAPVSQTVMKRSPGITEEIDRYNKIISEIAARYPAMRFVDVGSIVKNDADCVTDDGHITAAAHRAIGDTLLAMLEEEHKGATAPRP